MNPDWSGWPEPPGSPSARLRLRPFDFEISAQDDISSKCLLQATLGVTYSRNFGYGFLAVRSWLMALPSAWPLVAFMI